MDPEHYPFDVQNCSISIGSWQYDSRRINLFYAYLDSEHKASDLAPNPTWDVIPMNASDTNTETRIEADLQMDSQLDNNDLLNNDLVFQFKLKRLPLYFIINNIYPSLILNIISLLAFCLPFASQVGLCNII